MTTRRITSSPPPTGQVTGLVGHARPVGRHARDLERVELSRLLGLDPAAVASLRDADVEAALERLNGLIDRVAELEARAVNDDLTGVLRRGAGLDALRLELARCRRLSLPLTVAFLDVDGLKRVNDTRGHAAGDVVLCAVASTLTRRLRATDLVIRLGGDEFVCVLPGATFEDAEHVLGEVGGAIVEATGGTPVSIGLATIDPATPEPAEPVAVVDAADLDLYGRRAERARHAVAG